MFKFSNFKLLTKILVLFAMLGCVVIGGTFFSTSRMEMIDEAYSGLIDGSATASLKLANADKSVTQLVLGMADLLMSVTDEGNKQAEDMQKNALASFKDNMKAAGVALAAKRSAMEALVGKLQNAVEQSCKEALKLGAASTTAEGNAAAQAEFLKNCQPALDPVTAAIRQLVNDEEAVMQKENDATTAITKTTINMTYAVIITGFLLVVALAIFLTNSGISKPVRKIADVLSELARNNLSVEVVGSERKDEIGQIASAVLVFKEKLVEAEKLRADQEQAKGRAEAEKRAMMNKMADEFESSVKGIVQMVTSASTELQATAQSLSATAEETTRQATAVATASEEASSNVQTVATAAEELSSSISEISRQVSESARIAGEANTQATTTNTQIQSMAEAAQKIGDVVKLITDIASQTNLLALNATIEAARAGELGKGFAVVASEVKSLANQTAKATEEISAKITEMQTATGQSVHAVKTIGETIGRINEIATAIASAVEEQGAATKEIARNVEQASAGTSEVSSNISGVTQAAGQTGASASQVLDASSELAKQSASLQIQVDGFIAKIRAA